MISPRRVAFLVTLGLLAVASSRASAAEHVGLDPFKSSAGKSQSAFNPFRLPFHVADATPAPVSTPAPKAAAAPQAPPAPRACSSDAQCPDETICEQNVCGPVPSSINIAYLYYRDGAFREIFGLYWSKRGASGYTVFAPFYWHTWNPGGRTHAFAPFIWRVEDYKEHNVLWLGLPFYVSSANPDRSFAWAFPLSFFWREKDAKHQLVIPLFYRTTSKDGGSFFSWFGYSAKDGPRTDGAALWVWWFGQDRKAHSGYNVFFPLVWDFYGRDDRSTVIFPLVWRFASGASSTTVAGPWVSVRRPNSSFDTVLPLWWSGRDTKVGSAFKMLLPLFYWQSRDHGARELWLSPLIGGWSRDDEARSRTLTLLPLLSFWRHDPDLTVRVFTPLYVYARSEVADSTTNWLGLLAYYRRDDPRGSTMAVTPLFWRFHDAETGASATALLPFFARREGARDTTTFVGVFPLGVYWRSFKGGGWSGGLFPLAFFGENAGRSHGVLFPLFWRTAGANDSTMVAAPLFYWHRDPRGSAGGVPLALAFWGANGGESYAVQFPLFWHFANEHERTSTTVLPVGYLHRDPDGWSLGAGPVLPILWVRSGQTRSHFVLFPILWHFSDAKEDRSTTVVGPYWHRSWGHETTDALFPFLHWRRGARPGGTDETSFTLFPLFHYHRDATTRVFVSPLVTTARGPERSAGFVGPYFWYKDATLDASFIPFLHADITRRDTGERTRQYGPWFQLDGPGREARVLFPIGGHYKDAHESDTFFFPTFFHMRRDDGTRVDTLLPLFWRSSSPGRSTTIVTLWFDHSSPGTHLTGFFPVYFHSRTDARTLTIVPPLLFVRHVDHKADSEQLWWALLWHSRERTTSRTVVFPLWWARQSDAGGYKILFPLFWRYTDTKADKASTFAGPFYWSSWGTGRTAGLLPIFWVARNRADGSGSTGVMPFFYEAHGPNRFAFGTLLFGFGHSPTTRFNYVGPLWFSHTNVVTETSTSVIPPLLFFRRSTPDASLTTMLALFWRRADVTSSTTLGLPLYYDFHDYSLSRTTVFFPLVLRHANEVEQSVWWLAPLFYRHSTPTDSTTVAFPFVWDYKRGAERTTIVFPLFARWHRADHDSTWVFPTIYRRTGLDPSGAPDGTWHTVVAPFYAAAVKRPGDYMWEVLGGLFGHESVGRNRYLKLLFMRFEQEPAPRAQTAWYSQPARTPRRQPVRGLSMNTW